MHNHTTADAPETVRFVRTEAKRFDNMLEERKHRGKLDGSWRTGATGKDVFNWWMEYDILPGQIDLFDDEEVE